MDSVSNRGALMGVFEQGRDKARAQHRQGILDEACRAGSLVEQVQEYQAEERLQADALQVFRLTTGDLQHLYVQPFAGLDPLPGEHHARLDGTLPATAVLRKRMFGAGKWDAGDDRVTARMLADAGPLAKVVAKLRWKWQHGATKEGMSWLVQLRPVGEGGTHLVMRAGSYGSGSACRVGLPQFVLLCKRVAPLLSSGGASAEAGFFEEPLFAGLFESILLGRQVDREPEVSEQPRTLSATRDAAPHTELIRAFVEANQGRRVHLAPVPEKKARAVREGLLPDQAVSDELVALVDLTMMTGTARDAVVFTPSHCHAKEVDVTASFPLDRLVRVHGYANRLRDRIDVEIEGRGRMRVPVGSHGPLLLELFQQLAAHNRPPSVPTDPGPRSP